MAELPVILYVEDDPKSRKLMELLLKSRMRLPHVTILDDSQQFVARVAALDPRPTLILLDIHVSPYDGFEMLKLLRQFEWCARVPVVALTASVMNEEVQRLKQAGFDGCLAKPLEMETFPDMLNRIVAGERIWRIGS